MSVWSYLAGLSLALLTLSAPAQAGLGSFFLSNTEKVKEGVLEEYSPSVRVGKALDNYYFCYPESRVWKELTTDRDEEIVEFSCELQTHMLISLYPAADFAKGLTRFTTDLNLVDPLLAKEAREFKDLHLKVRFAMHVNDGESFSLDSIAADGHYRDGTQAKFPLPDCVLKAVFDNREPFGSVLSYGSKEDLKELFLSMLDARFRVAPASGDSDAEESPETWYADEPPMFPDEETVSDVEAATESDSSSQMESNASASASEEAAATQAEIMPDFTLPEDTTPALQRCLTGHLRNTDPEKPQIVILSLTEKPYFFVLIHPEKKLRVKLPLTVHALDETDATLTLYSENTPLLRIKALSEDCSRVEMSTLDLSAQPQKTGIMEVTGPLEDTDRLLPFGQLPYGME